MTIRIVTINYLDGTILQATVLSSNEHEIRAIAPGCDETLLLTRAQGVWHSEGTQAATLEFEWQRIPPPPACEEDECICPKELAAHLIRALLVGSEQETVEDRLYAFSPEGSRVAIQPTELRPN